MSNSLHLTLVQSKLHWEDIPANLKMFETKLMAIPKGSTDIVILPEMFTTAFSMKVLALAETMEGQSLNWMREMARQIDAVVCGSLIISEGGKYFNRFVWMKPDGTYELYDKRHRFSLAEEDKYFECGSERLIVDHEGWKICPLICYDLRFPVWARNTVDYDLLIYVANWPFPRRDAWKTLLMARAIENQAYTIGVNRVGKDGMGLSYVGDSAAIDYAGNTLCQITNAEELIQVRLFKDRQQQFRDRFGFLADRDKFQITG